MELEETEAPPFGTHSESACITCRFCLFTIAGLESLALEEVIEVLGNECIVKSQILTGMIIIRVLFVFDTLNDNDNGNSKTLLLSQLLTNLRRLRSVTKIIILVGKYEHIALSKESMRVFIDENFQSQPQQTLWKMAFQIWEINMRQFAQPVEHTPDEDGNEHRQFESMSTSANQIQTPTEMENPSIPNNLRRKKRMRMRMGMKQQNNDWNWMTRPKFRCTCIRKGAHAWKSVWIEQELAGPCMQALPQLAVDLTYYDLQVFCFVSESEFLVYGITIFDDLHIRNREVRAYRTVLNNCTCYLMLRLAIRETRATTTTTAVAHPHQNHDHDNDHALVCVDPFCGLASIAIEGMDAFPPQCHIRYIATDINQKALSQAAINYEYMMRRRQTKTHASSLELKRKPGPNLRSSLEIHEWNAKELHLHLSENSVDVIITDLPFGDKCGSHKVNLSLYPIMLKSMHRVLKLNGNGKALLLTTDTNVLKKSIADMNESAMHVMGRDAWQRNYQTRSVNVGGHLALLFVLIKNASMPVNKRDKIAMEIGTMNTDEKSVNAMTARCGPRVSGDGTFMAPDHHTDTADTLLGIQNTIISLLFDPKLKALLSVENQNFQAFFRIKNHIFQYNRKCRGVF